MKRTMVALMGVGLLVGGSHVHASGPIGVYAIVEKVTFEPNEAGAQRVKVSGAFAYVSMNGNELGGASPATKGYLYFKLPDDAGPATAGSAAQRIHREWADLKVVAGTGQAVAFGNWFYVGGFNALKPDVKSTQIIENSPGGGFTTDLRVRPEFEAPGTPVSYQTNAGVVKIAADGPHADVVKALHAALGK